MNLSTDYISFLKELDSSGIDHINYRNTGKKTLDKYHQVISDNGSDLESQLFAREWEILNLNMSIDSGIEPMTRGTEKLDDGTEREVIWPDYRLYNQTDLDYFEFRYENCNDLFLRTKYGLYLFLNGKLNHNQKKHQLAEDLWDLSLAYYSKSLEETGRMYRHSFSYIVHDVVRLCVRSKHTALLKLLSKHIDDLFKNSSSSDDQYFTVAYLVFDVLLEFSKELSGNVNTELILGKAKKDIDQIATKNPSSATALATRCLKLSNRTNSKLGIDWAYVLGDIYEKIGDESEELGRNNSMLHYSDAVRFYKLSKDKSSVERAQTKYESTRGKLKLGKVSSKIEGEEAQQIDNYIQGIIDLKKFDAVIGAWILVDFIPSASTIKASIASRKDGITMLFAQSALDKFGNTVEMYTTDEEKKEYQFWQSFGFSYQIGLQIAVEIIRRSIRKPSFIERIKGNRKVITRNSMESFLKNSWLNEPIERFYAGEKHNVVPLDTIIPPVLQFIDELDALVNSKGKVLPDFICTSDSLALKVEGILRLMCEKVGISTSIQKLSRNKHHVMGAKLMSQLINDIESHKLLAEKDILLLKYVVVHPDKLNIRNEIAHSLKDKPEYGPSLCIQLIMLILRLSMYKLESPVNTDDHE